VRIGECAKGPTEYFPAIWPVDLSTGNIPSLESKPYVVTPKPFGTRYLLYVDPSGEMLLENLTQHIFRIDDDHAIKMISSDGQPITDVILDGVVTRVSEKHPDAGRLTFVIMDAILCRGVGLTQMGISQRIVYIKVNSIIVLIKHLNQNELKLIFYFDKNEIMAPRLEALKNGTIKSDGEAFNLDIVDCKESFEAEEFMSKEFRDVLFKYPLLSILFIPKDKVSLTRLKTTFDVMVLFR
jgi:hypothetical protein